MKVILTHPFVSKYYLEMTETLHHQSKKIHTKSVLCSKRHALIIKKDQSQKWQMKPKSTELFLNKPAKRLNSYEN